MAQHDTSPILLTSFPPTLNDVLRNMAENKASDAFISAGAPIKIKINGAQVAVSDGVMNIDDIAVLLGDLNSGQLTALDQTHELNCAISLPGVGRFRLSAFSQRGTNALVVRYIPFEIPDMESLGLPSVLADLALMQRGLVLVVGPTGSGKSTTLASMLNYRNQKSSDHIITIEDPIEFLFKHKESIVNQREVGSDSASFEEALRNAMRQAPDVIFIGEIRDKTTMSLAMHYAQSGHLCLATLHADNTYQAIGRMVGFYEPAFREGVFQDLANSLQAVIAQRLIPAYDNSRIAAVEVLVTTTLIQDLISKGEIRKIPESMERSLASGTATFENQLLGLVKEKRVSVQNALKYSDSASNLYWKLTKENLHIDATAAHQAGVSQDHIEEHENQLKASLSADTTKPHDPFSNISLQPGRI